jgi:carbonic anhydrase/acetyltransferase-like protein (isoleucine patch superfamily)
MPVLGYEDAYPLLGDSCFIAPTAYVIGRVQLGAECSVWFSSVVRGDTGEVRLGSGVNVQEGSTIHTEKDHDVVIADDVTLGHHAVVHGATVQANVLIGINSSVLTGARVGSGSIIGAHALVPEGKVIPPRSLVLGSPGKVVREVTEAEFERILRTARNYRKLASSYAAKLPSPFSSEAGG